jgi:hypothetical protein
MSDYKTQQQRILALLESKESIALPEVLALYIANYRGRISELRAQGYDIRCETEWVGRTRRSRYRLVRAVEQQNLLQGVGNGL